MVSLLDLHGIFMVFTMELERRNINSRASVSLSQFFSGNNIFPFFLTILRFFSTFALTNHRRAPAFESDTHYLFHAKMLRTLYPVSKTTRNPNIKDNEIK